MAVWLYGRQATGGPKWVLTDVFEDAAHIGGRLCKLEPISESPASHQPIPSLLDPVCPFLPVSCIFSRQNVGGLILLHNAAQALPLRTDPLPPQPSWLSFPSQNQGVDNICE